MAAKERTHRPTAIVEVTVRVVADKDSETILLTKQSIDSRNLLRRLGGRPTIKKVMPLGNDHCRFRQTGQKKVAMIQPRFQNAGRHLLGVPSDLVFDHGKKGIHPA